MILGSEVLVNKKIVKELRTKRVGLLAHPASTDHECKHIGSQLSKMLGKALVCAFGPQHGIRGEKQDNMVESSDLIDPALKIPVYSLYGENRRPTTAATDSIDTLVVDLQDVGTRIYTFITTLFYFMEAFHGTGKEIVILDRPNPAGRKVEGLNLDENMVSFVGCSPGLILRHGLTLGELANYFKAKHGFDLNITIVPMKGYATKKAPGWGWPDQELSWVNPSPNIPRLSTVKVFPGTVLLEGTTLSEGRGTTRPLEVMGAPLLDTETLLNEMERMGKKWIAGCKLRPCYFEPMFQKHSGKLCSGFQIHTDYAGFNPEKFSPFRLIALSLKALRNLNSSYPIWNTARYEYESDRLSFDLICGTTLVREWVEDKSAKVADLESLLRKDEKNWHKIQREFALYK